LRRYNAAWGAMEALVDAGKTKAIGLTNASVPIVESICKVGPQCSHTQTLNPEP
jgi:diketogulonate reductase-like aldo/keto reductase